MEPASPGEAASAVGVGKAKADNAMESNSVKLRVCIVNLSMCRYSVSKEK